MTSIHTPPPSDVSLWLTFFDDDRSAHVVPDFGSQHVLTLQCWCHPEIEDERYTEPGVIVHNVAQ